jgi:ABC-type sugar transport system ATPase subunit
VADRIAVMYLGTIVAQDKLSNFDRQRVVEYITTGGQGAKANDPRTQAAAVEHGHD